MKNIFFVLILTDTDGELSASDAAYVLQKVLISTYTLPIENNCSDYFRYIDVDADGDISASDCSYILQKVLVSTFIMPAETTTESTTETTTKTTTESTTESTTETTTEATTETTEETTTEITTSDTYYPYEDENGLLYVDIINGMVVGCGDNYTGGRLPEIVEGTEMTRVSEDAFNNSNIEEIIIPEGYSIIANGAFRNSTNLKKVTFENNSVTAIYANAFRNCTSLSEVILPDSLRVIRDNAFVGCTALEKLVIPENVTQFGRNIADENCVLYVCSDMAVRYAEQYGYKYVKE